MYLLSGFNSNNATSFVKVNSNPRSCLNTGVIKSLARKFRIQRRERKMDFTVLIGSAVELASSHHKSHMLSIEALRQRYMKGAKVHISPKCFHNRLDQRGLADFANALLTVVMNSYSKLCALFNNSVYAELTAKLGLNDIILIDGTEINVRETLSKEYDCKGKYHAGLKLHVAFSLKKQSIEYISLTAAVDSERAQVIPENYHNTLFIMDAGYMGRELEERIVNSGNHFLIKGKVNSCAKVIYAHDDHGKLISSCFGCKVSDLPLKHNIRRRVDMIADENGRQLRIIRAKNRSRDDDSEVFAYLRTSLPRSNASAFQIHQLYRLSWLVELFMKCLKSGNGLQGINSSKKEIVFFWITICVLSSVLKSIFALLSLQGNKNTVLSLLKVQQSPVFEGFFLKLIRLKDSAYYEARNKLLKLIASNCQRTKPSLRDSHKLKDVILLLKSIIKNRTITKWSLGIA